MARAKILIVEDDTSLAEVLDYPVVEAPSPDGTLLWVMDKHGHGGVFDMQQGGGEYALTLGVISAALILTGAGRFTVTNLVRHARPKRAAK